VAQYELDSFELSVLKVERTLVEKLLGIIKDSYLADPIARIGNRIRHLYDVCMMLRKPEIRDFVESPEFKKMCEICISDEVETWSSEDTACLATCANAFCSHRQVFADDLCRSCDGGHDRPGIWGTVC